MSGLGLGVGIDLLGWSLALVLAGFAGWLWVREGRRRGALNRALHELRRPLQILTLSAPASAPSPRQESAQPTLDVLEQAIGAVADLDRALNGGAMPAEAAAVSLHEPVEKLIARWQALLGPEEINFRWVTGEEWVMVDPLRLRQALENLIANANEHGRLPIEITAAALPSGVRLSVADAGPASRLDRAPRGRGRRGHGLAIAAEFAAAHGGALRSWRDPGGGTVVAIDLPCASARRLPGSARRASLGAHGAAAAPLSR